MKCGFVIQHGCVAALVIEVVGWTVRDRGTVTVMTGRKWIKQFTVCMCGWYWRARAIFG